MDTEYNSMMPVHLVLLIEVYLVSFVYSVQNMLTGDLNFKECHSLNDKNLLSEH